MNRIVNTSVFNNPISASSLRGIIHNDPILTILENHIDIFPTGNMSRGTELNIQNGIEYENNVIERIQSRADQLGLTYDFEMNQGIVMQKTSFSAAKIVNGKIIKLFGF